MPQKNTMDLLGRLEETLQHKYYYQRVQEFKQQRYFVSSRGQCLLDVKFKIAQKGRVVTTRYLVDAFERRIYGTFYDVGNSNARPLTCNYGVNFNEAGQCANESEFESVIAQLVN